MKKWILAIAGMMAPFCMAQSAQAALVYASWGDTSAYIRDWAVGPDNTNYAFLTSTGAFVGSWEVDQGPSWSTAPTAYSGQSAAAFLFGGNAADYTISTTGNIFADADHMTWVSTFGGGGCSEITCGTKVAESFVTGTMAAPEPAAWSLMILGIGAVGFALRKRHRLTLRYS